MVNGSNPTIYYLPFAIGDNLLDSPSIPSIISMNLFCRTLGRCLLLIGYALLGREWRIVESASNGLPSDAVLKLSEMEEREAAQRLVGPDEIVYRDSFS